MTKERDFYQVSLKTIIKNSEGEILIAADAAGSYLGFFDLPGGRIDIDEFTLPLMEIIQREIREELGDAAKIEMNEKPIGLGRHLIPAKFNSLNKDIHVFYIFFEGKYLGGDIKLSEEHSGFQWVDLNKIELKKYFKSGILEGIKMYLSK